MSDRCLRWSLLVGLVATAAVVVLAGVGWPDAAAMKSPPGVGGQRSLMQGFQRPGLSKPIPGYRGDAANYPPPATGTFAYNAFVPAASYVDPVFTETVRRLTSDHAHDDIYARNMWWNADGTRYLHRTIPDTWKVIDTATGQVTHSGIENGYFPGDGGFDPVDPAVLYYLAGASIHKITLGAAGAVTDTVYWTAPGGVALKGLGGTLNWFDRSGRYMLVRYGPEPSVRVLDRQNLAAGPYAGAIDGSQNIDVNSYLGLSPDGQFVVGYASGGTMGEGVSYAINHAGRSVAISPTRFWSLCGDHGSFISPSDGRTYMIVHNCTDAPELWRVDVTNTAANNKRLIVWPTWNECCGHVSTSAQTDWAFVATEDRSDAINGAVSPWHAYRQEIVAVNVLTGEIRRLVHHRSRGQGGDYYAQPRISASWNGAAVAFPSNYNQAGVVDIFMVPFVAVPPPPPTPLAPASPKNLTVAQASRLLRLGSGNVSPSLPSNLSVVQPCVWGGQEEFYDTVCAYQ